MKSVSNRAVKRPETDMDIAKLCVGTSMIPHEVVRLEKRARDCIDVAKVKMLCIGAVVRASGDALNPIRVLSHSDTI